MTFRNYFHLLAVVTAAAVATISCKFLVPEEPPVQAGAILFQDDFSDPQSGWNRVSTDTGETDYDDGVYRILVNESNTDIWSKPGQSFEDAVIEVINNISLLDDKDFDLIIENKNKSVL